ncbi:hypothetical protein [Psychrosphaera algicola]|uniref:Uncharacterized protein n=1 Tax=Psychrosphaera algicola TaxID=3023714 RepID=A0ABT5FBR0_9GAMM|nr:hypothetical protein [Psychrosphaera sp. G1-22]MDC2888975.1 hypothetical protein [Psychrosphaera sp. G1-22]
MSCEKDWVDITSALLTPVIAIIGIGIAILQWRINRSRLRHELFEKRYAIYEATLLYLGQLIRTAKMDDVERVTFLQNTKGAFVLFDDKIIKYLKNYTINQQLFIFIKVSNSMKKKRKY